MTNRMWLPETPDPAWIEVMARAINSCVESSVPWEQVRQPWQEVMRIEARAAYTALRQAIGGE